MSCGEHHDVDCSEILQRVYVFIDNELEDATQADCAAGANVLMHTVLALAGVAS